jgi:hypothetical protein
MIRQLIIVNFLLFAVANLSFAVGGGAGLEFEELIPRDDYDPNTIESVKAKVSEVLNVAKMTGMGNAVIIRFAGPRESLYVILAPDWFLKNQEFEVKENDLISIRGSKVSYQDKQVIIASEVSREGKTLHLRNEKTGNPEWSEWRKGEEIFYKNYNW